MKIRPIKTRKDYDTELLRLVRSKLEPADGQPGTALRACRRPSTRRRCTVRIPTSGTVRWWWRLKSATIPHG